ncbi:MAG: AgmX/PglI C-terminal domain-containing protein [Deltaproteobacteria bacterium]|nr:AgmX/PglI C-terminal domain-containing protein [Deltaproteobacteria bacterium]
MNDENLQILSGKGWLYKQNDMLYGPVPSQVIADLINKGILNANSEIAIEDGEWKKIKDIKHFNQFIIQYEARKRREAIEREERRQKRLGILLLLIKITSALLIFSIIGMAGYFGYKKFILPRKDVRSPIEDDSVEITGVTMDEWLEKHPPLVALGTRKIETKTEEAKVEEKLSKDTIKKGRTGKEKKGTKDTDKGTKVAKADIPTQKSPESDMPEQLTDAEIYEMIQKNISKLFICIREELQRTPDLRGEILIEFVIKNDGRIGDLKIEDPRFASGPMYDCFLKKLMMWKFRSFYGERKIVKYPFYIKSKK